jgi:hypothetical protein
MIMPTWILDVMAYIFGYAYSILIGHYVASHVLDCYYQGYEEGRAVEKWRSGVVGLVERALYTSAFLMSAPEFIAIWLAFKVAGQWERWKADWGSKARQDELKKKQRKDTARAMYSGYLVGNALSIAYGTVGAVSIEKGLEGEWPTAILVPAALLVSTWLLYLHVRCQQTHAQAAKTPPKPGTNQRQRVKSGRAA